MRISRLKVTIPLFLAFGSGACSANVDDEDPTTEQAEATQPSGMPLCVKPKPDLSCLDDCKKFDDTERDYLKNPLNGKLAGTEATNEFTILTEFNQEAFLNPQSGPAYDGGTVGASITGFASCDAVKLIGQAFFTISSVWNALVKTVHSDYCSCVRDYKLKKYIWSVPPKVADCQRSRQCWDPDHQAVSTEAYKSSAHYHGDKTKVFDGMVDDYEIDQKVSCSSVHLPTPVRVDAIGNEYYPMVTATCGAFSKTYDTDVTCGPGDNSPDTCAKMDACTALCNPPPTSSPPPHP
jgi:hypothetical protein